MHLAAPFLCSFLLIPQAGMQEPPQRITWSATRAVEGDSVAAVAARWRGRVRRDATDRAAALGLATLALLSYDYETALRDFDALSEGGGDPPDAYAVHARLGRAHVLRNQARYGESDTAYAGAIAAAAALGDSVARGEALMGRALVQVRLVGRSAAESLLGEAEPYVIAGGPALEGRFRCIRAAVLGLGADEARAGAELARQAGEPGTRAQCLWVVAQRLMSRGVSDSALTTLDAVVPDLRRTGNRYTLAAALQWRGWYRTAIGDYRAARSDLHEAIREAEASGNFSVQAWALLNLGQLSLTVGDVASGSEYATRAAELFEAQGDLTGLTNILSLQGSLAARAGDMDAARDAYRAALARHVEAGNGVGIVTQHQSLADLALTQRDWPTAERELMAARAAARERGMTGWEQGLLGDFAELASGRRESAAAERLWVEALSLPQQPVRSYQIRAQLAGLHARDGEVERAGLELAEAADQLDEWRAGLDDRQLRIHAFQLSETDRGVATVIAGLAAAGRLEAAFGLAERRRARELLDRMIRADELAFAGGSVDVADVVRSRPGSVSLAQLRAALPDDGTALLQFVTGRGGEPTTLFAVTRAGAAAYRLEPIDSLADAVSRFAALVGAGSDAGRLGASLGSGLLGAAVNDLPAHVSRLVIVAEDALHRVPFDALLLGDGRFVLERFSTSLVPSATVAVRLWTQPGSGREASILALGDPRFEDEMQVRSAEAEVYGSAFDDAGGLPRLAASGREARRVARYGSRADVRLRERASEAHLKNTPLHGYDVLHLATHAIVDELADTRTALALAPGEGEDGFLGPAELAALELDASLVVLSACRSAGGVVVRGEGIQGLTAPLLEAGARSVAATAWRIGDRATVRLVDAFYDALADGMPTGDALRSAKLAALRSGAPASEWAAFTLVGDQSVTVPLERPGARWYRWVLGAVFVLALGWVVLRYSRRTRNG